MTTPITDPGHLDRLIDRQQRLWEVRRALASEGGPAARREFAHLPEGPWLTVSSETGAGGSAVARDAAEELGWQVFDHEILAAIASHAERRGRLLADFDEHPLSTLGDLVAHMVVPGHTTRAAYELELVRVIAGIGKKGRAVLIGRGANWVLDPRFGLRVRVIAPREARVAAIASRDSIAESAAARRVERADEEKAAFIRQVYRREIADPAGYDLVVNGADLAPGEIAAIVVLALRRKLERRPVLATATP